MEIDVLTVGLACPLGLTALEAQAALRANLRSVYRLEDADELEARFGELIRASRRPELGPELTRAQRIAAYAQRALREATSPFGAQLRGVPLYLATPEASASAGFEIAGLFGELAGGLGSVQFCGGGRAGVFEALRQARAGIERGGYPLAVVGGADSMADHASVLRLAEAGALLGDANPDGLIPGEGAAFLVVACSTMGLPGRPSLARLGPVVLGEEPIPPALVARQADGPVSEAEGLTRALASLRERDGQPVDALHSAQPPQRHWARELAFVVGRHRPAFVEPLALRRCAEALGDLGAAAGAVALVTAILELYPLIPGRAHAPPPERALVYACADAGQVGAGIVSAMRFRPKWARSS